MNRFERWCESEWFEYVKDTSAAWPTGMSWFQYFIKVICFNMLSHAELDTIADGQADFKKEQQTVY